MTRFTAPIAEQIWDMKYRFKNAVGVPIDITVEDTWHRIARTLADAENPDGLPATDESYDYPGEFYGALEDFKFTPAGRIVAGAGTARAVTMFNCFVMGTIPDSMVGIFDMLKEAALTMQQGGGIGYDFSPIRPSTSMVKKLGADASGPLSFMDVWDAMCRTVMSAGSRRGAMMATLRCDHPDIMGYIAAKKDPARLRMFNLSVLATDEFMAAVEADGDWILMHAEPPIHRADTPSANVNGQLKNGQYAHDTIKARDLWEAMMESTYAQAEPGVIFIDRINRANNLNYCEDIASSNPCGEQPLPPYGACLLGSINLARLVEGAFTEGAGIDQIALKKLVAIAVRMLDNVIDVSNFPLPQQEKEAKAKRRIGLGVTGLANALAMCGLRYGSPEAVARTKQWMQIIDEAAYAASVELAREKGAFPLFDADKYLAAGTHASTLSNGLQDDIREHGIRNALLTSIAPTGTISLYAGNVSSGIEPTFAFSYTRKVLQPDGSRTEELVEDYAVALYREFWNNSDLPLEDPRVFDPDVHLPDYFVSAQTLTPTDHLVMQAAAQVHVDSAISKTINCPEDIDFDDFKEVYMQAYKTGCKGVTTYRPNEITGSVLSVEEKPQEPEANDLPPIHPEGFDAFLKEKIGETLPARPDELDGTTYKIKVGDQKAVYLTVNDMIESDGTVRAFEIFLRSSDPTSDEWMTALSRMISAVLRRRHDAMFVPRQLRRIHSATTGGFQRGGGGHQPSIVAAIGAKLQQHMEQCSLTIHETDESVSVRSISQAPSPNKPCGQCFSYNTKFESGCLTCLDCGESKCG